jgi:hypothetical protein
MNRKLYLIGGIALAVILVVTLIVVLLPKNSVPKNLSAQALFLFDGESSKTNPGNWKFESNAIGSSSASKIDQVLVCPEASSGIFAFLSKRGNESQIDGGWQAFSESGFVPGTHKVLTPNLQLSGLYLGSPGAQYIKKIGGDFSLGLACTNADKNNVLTVSYVYVRVEAGSGSWQIVPN